MLITLMAWILITLVCRAWGLLVLQRLHSWFKKEEVFIPPPFSIMCVTGFAFVTVFAGILSLWMPLGGWIAPLLVIAPCFLLFFQVNTANLFGELKKQFAGLSPAIMILFALGIVMVLVMSTWTINHPDTLAYHAQTIHWIEKYKIVPGLVHLSSRYGSQGQWFVSCALFSFRFTGTEALTFINSTFLIWYLLFIIQKINHYLFIGGQRIHAFLWLLLFAASALSYTQVRLTATSASPDFIATLLIWMVFYLFLKKDQARSPLHWVLVIILSIFSITVKLSAAPLLLVALYACIQLLRLKKIKALFISFSLALLILFPFIARNIITTGYLVFPSPFPDIVNVDWKFDKSRTELEKRYITAYARTHVDYAKPDVDAVMAMSPGKWLPLWWQNNSAADKAILLSLVIACIALIARVSLLARSSLETKTALVAAAAGIIFWFVEAPDPRFGFGFILSFVAIAFTLFCSGSSVVSGVSKKSIIVLIFFSALITGSYTGYRFVHFFSPSQLIRPIGIEKTSSVSFPCESIVFTKPAGDELCGDLPLPCVYTDSCNFILRGNQITDGFRAKTNNGK